MKLPLRNIIGLDIGGANIKIASAAGEGISCSFEIWKTPELLEETLQQLLQRFAEPRLLAVTMTAELADCFRTKAEGVNRIVDAVAAISGRADVRIWRTAGEFITPVEAKQDPLGVAAANWHALATWGGRWLSGERGLLIDIGSTTTDIIPLERGSPCSTGLTDVTRLHAGELVYTGVRRTPLCALALSVPFRGSSAPLAAEWFATTLDIYLLLGRITEQPANHQTADGRPATVDAAYDRLVRMLCADRTECTREEAVEMARFLADVQRQRIQGAMTRVLRGRGDCDGILVSGEGGFLARIVLENCGATAESPIVDLADRCGPQLSSVACAYALATLASEHFPAASA